ncbi:Hypothetical protein CAP_7725 [Chondromyces apiculatus DSM 436]|uniref:Uncharacterized protein n=1 Tax=Chondromyces apiculatus DSM 436 TaxID=1192034 RepID=A0A017SXX5_9BACT|nr:Hypothetical protein CAP_7725 [Chondromyces apiculatus DSM 436]
MRPCVQPRDRRRIRTSGRVRRDDLGGRATRPPSAGNRCVTLKLSCEAAHAPGCRRTSMRALGALFRDAAAWPQHGLQVGFASLQRSIVAISLSL